MRLTHKILLNLTLLLIILIGIWAVFFYFHLISEVGDEVDDHLERKSEEMIASFLNNHPLPTQDDGSADAFWITPITQEYREEHPDSRFVDELVFIDEVDHWDPVRTLKTIFCNKDSVYYEFSVSTPSFEKNDISEAILNGSAILFCLLLIVILLICYGVLYFNMRPLFHVMKWIENYTIGNRKMPLDVKTNVKEFNILVNVLHEETQRNEAVFESQKQFIGNASHELQTPLAVCQNRIEQLMDNEQLTEQQLIELSKIQSTLSGLIKLNKTLLFLTKIENHQYTKNCEVVFNNQVKELIELFDEAYSHKQIKVNLEEKGEFKVSMDEHLATSLISNLLKNAYRHNTEQGVIDICITHHHFIIKNTGTETPLDTQLIFERFYTGDRNNKGTSGLGLAIVDAICKESSLEINYSYSDKKHAFMLSKKG